MVRVHRAAGRKLVPRLVDDDIWEQRYRDIRSFERHLARGTAVLKFFLYVSRGEQRRRFLAHSTTRPSNGSSRPPTWWAGALEGTCGVPDT